MKHFKICCLYFWFHHTDHSFSQWKNWKPFVQTTSGDGRKLHRFCISI